MVLFLFIKTSFFYTFTDCYIRAIKNLTYVGKIHSLFIELNSFFYVNFIIIIIFAAYYSSTKPNLTNIVFFLRNPLKILKRIIEYICVDVVNNKIVLWFWDKSQCDKSMNVNISLKPFFSGAVCRLQRHHKISLPVFFKRRNYFIGISYPSCRTNRIMAKRVNRHLFPYFLHMFWYNTKHLASQ